MKQPVILHVRLDGLHAAIAARRAPILQSEPFVVASRAAGSRVLDVSSEAQALSLSPGKPVWEARAAFPGLIVVPPDLSAYEAARLRVMDLMLAFTPQLKPLGNREAFLDVTASLRLFGGREALVQRLRSTLAEALGIAPTLGIGENPLVAKIATHLAEPGGVNEITGEGQAVGGTPLPRASLAESLAALPVSLLWLVERGHRERLVQMGVRTFGQLRLIPSLILKREFGEAGLVMFEAARGRDDTVIPVYELGDVALAVRHRVQLPRPTREAAALRLAAIALAEQVAHSLRARGQSAQRLRLCIILRDRGQVQRTGTLRAAIDTEREIARHIEEMLGRVELGARQCIALEVAALGLTDAPAAQQLSLFDERPLREAALGAAKDEVLGRIGAPALIPASLEGSAVVRRSA